MGKKVLGSGDFGEHQRGTSRGFFSAESQVNHFPSFGSFRATKQQSASKSLWTGNNMLSIT